MLRDMPDSRFRIPLPDPLGFIALLLSLAFSDAKAQINMYSESRLNSTAQRVLPSTGPGSALFNPAALGEAKLAFIQSGNFLARSGYFPSPQLFGTDVTGYTQIAVTPTAILLPDLPVALSAGFAFTSNDTKIDGVQVPVSGIHVSARLGDFLACGTESVDLSGAGSRSAQLSFQCLRCRGKSHYGARLGPFGSGPARTP